MERQTAAAEQPAVPGLTKVPRHVAIIMDGNGRWARARGLPRLAGHRAGTDNIRRVLEGCVEAGVEILTIYAFSTENWERPEREVRGLMRLLEEVIERELDELNANGVQIRHCGWMDGVSERLQRLIRHAVELTKDNDRIILNVAFNYGGRLEIIRAVQAIIRDGIPAEEIDEALFESYLTTAGLPDPDLIIRTGGEMRLSNFMLWQGAYSEIYSTPTFWPDFDKQALFDAFVDYSRRERRFGRVPNAET
ncbi:MAG: di-trans,poly-cis-decaprenylcistransferase [Chloroflexi bacterium]|nr:MAG: di-trans,poly-cis-decaprenylcistransferase [Chloroflexota bacterium]